MSEDVLPSIEECMAKVMGDVREVAKTRTNPEQHFTFRGVDEVVNAVAPGLRKHGVVVLPHLDNIEYVPITTSKGKLMMSARVIVTFNFRGPRGDYVAATVPGEAFDAGDKGTAKAMSVAFRTALLQALALPTDDMDPDMETYEQAQPSAGHAERGVSAASGSLGGDPGTVQREQASLDGRAAPEAPEEVGSAPGEAATTPPSGASSLATAGMWDILMAATADGAPEGATATSIEKQVVNRINKANKSSFRDMDDARRNATVEQLDAALTAAR